MNSDKKPHRWTPTYNSEDILQVLPTEGEIKTATVKKRLAEIDSKYSDVTKEWFRKALIKLSSLGKVERIEKEDEKAVYWRKKV